MDEALFLRKYDNHNSLGKERDFGQGVRWPAMKKIDLGLEFLPLI